jgi:hypothetical protein
MELRASDTDREQTVERLRTAAMEGRLDSEELEQRVQSAYAAKFCAELSRLTADVTPAAPAPAAAPAPQPVRPTFIASGPSTNGFAIASLICAVAWFLWIGSVLAAVFGHIALRQIKASGGAQRGKGVAIAGLLLGYGGLLIFALALIAELLGA